MGRVAHPPRGREALHSRDRRRDTAGGFVYRLDARWAAFRHADATPDMPMHPSRHVAGPVVNRAGIIRNARPTRGTCPTD